MAPESKSNYSITRKECFYRIRRYFFSYCPTHLYWISIIYKCHDGYRLRVQSKKLRCFSSTFIPCHFLTLRPIQLFASSGPYGMWRFAIGIDHLPCRSNAKYQMQTSYNPAEIEQWCSMNWIEFHSDFKFHCISVCPMTNKHPMKFEKPMFYTSSPSLLVQWQTDMWWNLKPMVYA